MRKTFTLLLTLATSVSIVFLLSVAARGQVNQYIPTYGGWQAYLQYGSSGILSPNMLPQQTSSCTAGINSGKWCIAAGAGSVNAMEQTGNYLFVAVTAATSTVNLPISFTLPSGHNLFVEARVQVYDNTTPSQGGYFRMNGVWRSTSGTITQMNLAYPESYMGTITPDIAGGISGTTITLQLIPSTTDNVQWQGNVWASYD